jgi:hypothetical protein
MVRRIGSVTLETWKEYEIKYIILYVINIPIYLLVITLHTYKLRLCDNRSAASIYFQCCGGAFINHAEMTFLAAVSIAPRIISAKHFYFSPAINYL